MNTRQDIERFVAEKTLAIVGMSRKPHSFSANAAKELRTKGYRLFAVNPGTAEIEGETCYPSLAELPEKVGGVLFVTPPAATEQAVRDAVESGVSCLWIQQGAQSHAALAYCEGKDVNVVSGHCILMFAEPVRSIHLVHRWFKALVGGVPK